MSRHHELEAIFLECVALPEAKRAAFLEARCGADRELRARIESLIARDASEDRVSVAPVIALPAETPPPAAIGPYRIEGKLGEGGFGEVYAAEQTAPVRRRVAIKILRGGLDSRAVLARFEAERHALARMDHPGIAKVLDAGETDGGRPYFVMELVAGEPITEFCDTHALTTRERLELMVLVCRAVEHAHQKGVIHRDLKPSNLLISRTDGRPLPKVIDFGIAKATHTPLGEETLHTRQGEFLGTPEFASPEQAESGGADVDTRTDVYSLGVVLYRILCGKLPFDSEQLRSGGLAGLARVLRDTEPPRPSAAAAAAPAEHRGARPAELRGDLDWIVLKAIDRDRGRRYSSAAALADDLERHLRHEPVLAGPPGAGYRVGKFVRRHRPLVAGALAVVLALLAGIAATAWQAARARHESQIAASVSAFLTRMIAGANPETNPTGREISVREMVDRAVAELDAGGAASPEVEAAVRQAIGNTYMGLGLYEPAERQLTLAAGMRERLSGPRSAGAADARLQRIELAARRGRHAEAESLLAALAHGGGAIGTDPGLRIRHLQLLGGTLANLSREPEADSVLTAAVALARRHPDAVPGALGASLGELAGIRSTLGRFAEAESLGREALALTRAAHSGAHHDVAVAASRLAVIHQDAGQYAAAESLHREALEVDRRVLGAGHPTVGERLANLASAQVELGRIAEAESLHREAVALLRASLGEDHPVVASARSLLATVVQARGGLDEALALRRVVLASNQRSFGERHAEVAGAHNNLGSVLRLMGRYREAVPEFRAAIAAMTEIYGPGHPSVIVTTHNLGKTLLDAGDLAPAEAALRSAVGTARQVFPEGHVNVAVFESTHGRALGELGRFAEAETLLVSAHRRIAEGLGADHPRTIEVAGEIAKLYARNGRAREAARWRQTPRGAP